VKLRKPKKPARRQPPAWEVFRLKSSSAAFVGIVYADSSEAAIAAAPRKPDQGRLTERAPL
jgi:hypothetical protein